MMRKSWWKLVASLVLVLLLLGPTGSMLQAEDAGGGGE